MSRFCMLVVGAIGIFVAASPLFAHHRWPIDRSTEVTVQGTVTAYTWANPHVMISLDVSTNTGMVERWDVGGPSTNRMEANGWDRNTLTTGDVITGTGYHFTNGSNVLRLEIIVTSDGSELLLYGRR